MRRQADRQAVERVNKLTGSQANQLDVSLARLEAGFPASPLDVEPASAFAGLSTFEFAVDPFEHAVMETTFELNNIIVRKHRDYGPLNISRSPGGALNGLRVRMHDKLARINHLTDSGAEPENEPLRDSFLDMAGYALIGLLVLDGEWPS